MEPSYKPIEATFDRSGLGALSDLESAEWKTLFSGLEACQTEFLSKADQFRSPEYKWPPDPLHTWSRVWEYPYCYYHMRRWRSSLPSGATPKVVDLGSGVTFFPFAIARLGCNVTCTDTDPVAGPDLSKAAQCVQAAPGSVDFRLSKGPLPFEDGEADALYCVSVLEHVPNPASLIAEMARILKPGGLCVLTIDLDMRGDSEIKPTTFRSLIKELQVHFKPVFPDVTIHPQDLLTSARGPYPVPPRGGWVWAAKEAARRALGKSPCRRIPFVLTVMGTVLVSRKV